MVPEERVGSGSPPSSRPGVRLWLVEDEVLVGRLIESILADCGFEVRWFTEAETALREADNGLLPEVLVTDLALPGIDGLALASSLRGLDPRLPVLVTSGFGLGEDREALPDVEYLDKPFTPRLLLERLEAMGHATRAR